MPDLWSSGQRQRHRHDQRCGHSDAAVRGAVLPGLADRQGHRQARALRGPQLRRPGHPPVRGGRKGAGPEDQLGPARAAHRLERPRVPAPHHPKEDRRAGPVLRAVPPGARPAVDSGRGHHLGRREAEVRAGRRRRHRGHAEGARARRHPARDRRPAPAARAARRARADRPGVVHGAGHHLRPAARRPHRPDVCDDQREAHAPERVAPGVALGPSALSRRQPGGGARRRPRAERPRGLAALPADQAARRRARARSRRRRSRRN